MRQLAHASTAPIAAPALVPTGAKACGRGFDGCGLGHGRLTGAALRDGLEGGQSRCSDGSSPYHAPAGYRGADAYYGARHGQGYRGS